MSSLPCAWCGTPTSRTHWLNSECPNCAQLRIAEKNLKITKERASREVERFRDISASSSVNTSTNSGSNAQTEFPFTFKQVAYFVVGSLVILFVVYLIRQIVGLLSSPSTLPYPHKIFAYFYHYIFKSLYEAGSLLFIAIKYLWTEINLISEYKNLNFVAAIISCSLFMVALCFTAFKVYKKLEGEVTVKDISVDKRILILLITVIPIPIWFIYWILELIIRWLFHT
jgi:hypothetical protein